MKSKITIEIDHDNQPIIRINYEPSEDVRDGLVKRFLETFGGSSSYASFRFVDTPHDKPNSLARIRPIKPEEMADVSKTMQEEASNDRQASNGGGAFIQKENLHHKLI